MPAVIGPSFEVAWRPPVDARGLPAVDRRVYWEKALEFVLAEKDADLARGLDRYGDPLTPISQYTREHRESAMDPPDPNAPPLTPAYEKSRTRVLLTGKALADGVVCWWLYDLNTKGSWGVILGYHAEGSDSLPVRDVIGLSRAAIERARAATDRWWASTRAKQAREAAKAEREADRKPVRTYQFGAEHKETPLRNARVFRRGEARAAMRDRGLTFGADGKVDWQSHFASKVPKGGFPSGPYRVGRSG